MDTKVKKIRIEYAKYRTNGFIIDFIVKSLGIEQKDEKLQKTYQRFIKEESISANEYHDTLNTIMEDILYNFFESRDDQWYKYYENYFKEFFSFYNSIKLENDTLVTSQKQLDFINLITLFIPIFRANIFDEKIKLTLAQILRDKKVNAIKSLFSTIQSFLGKEHNIKEVLFDILDKSKLLSDDAINKNINNWINGKTVPSTEHIELISELALLMPKFYTKNELRISFKIVKIVDFLYKKSIKYFGEELTSILMRHYEYFDKFYTAYQHSNENREKFEAQLKQDYSFVDFKYLSRYLDMYFYYKLDLDFYFKDKAYHPDKYIKNESKIVLDFIKDNHEYENIFYKMNEKNFFDTIDTIVPVRYFHKEKSYNDLKDLDEKLLDTEYMTYRNDLDKLLILTLPKEKKSEDSEDTILKKIKLFEIKYDSDTDPYFNFLKARYYAQKRKYKTATKYYLEALKYGKNCIGSSIKSVIKEGLIVSAQETKKSKIDLLNAKSAFTKFYKEAYFYELIKDLPEERDINFLNDTKKQFDIYFKKLFPNVEKAKDEHISPNFSFGVEKDIKIDYTKPNKLIKEFNPITQLIYCSTEGNYNCVKQLIDNGADVNLLKASDNASALLLAFPFDIKLPLNDNALKIAKLLIPKMSQEALNTRLIKQQESVLSYAIVYGLVDIVELLIKYGVDVEEKITLDEVTPLYLAIKCIAYSKKDNFDESNPNFIKNNPYTSKKEMGKLAKANKFSTGIFDDERKEDVNNIEQTALFKNIELGLKQMSLAKYKENKENYYKIFDLLLNVSKKIDVSHINNFTPLIFATEINEEDLVIKLLKKGANPDWLANGLGTYNRAYDYACVNKNKNLMELLA